MHTPTCTTPPTRQVTALVEHLVSEETQNKQLRWAILFLFVFVCVLLAGTFGLTWAVVAALKDTKVDGVVLQNKEGQTVQVGSVDTTLISDLLVPRMYTTGNVVNGSSNVTSVVRSAQYTGTRMPFSPLISSEALMELNYIVIRANTSMAPAELMLKVNGAARIPSPYAPYGTYVRILTSAGTITLNATLEFDAGVADVLSEFDVATQLLPSGRRALLASPNSNDKTVSTDGLFNTIGDEIEMDPSLWDTRSSGSDVSAARSKADKTKKALDKADQGNAGAQAVLLANWKAWKATYYGGSELSSWINSAPGEFDTVDQARFGTFKQNLRKIANLNAAASEWHADGMVACFGCLLICGSLHWAVRVWCCRPSVHF